MPESLSEDYAISVRTIKWHFKKLYDSFPLKLFHEISEKYFLFKDLDRDYSNILLLFNSRHWSCYL